MSKWTLTDVQETQKQVRADVLAASEHLKEEAVGGKLMAMLNKAAEDTSSKGRLRLIFFIIEALLYQEKTECYSNNQVGMLRRLGLDVLQVSGIKPEGTSLSFLYGTIFSVVSQIHRRSGSHFRALWEQSLAGKLTSSISERYPAHQNLALGNRLMRVGDVKAGLECFSKALAAGSSGGLTERNTWNAKLASVKALRILGKVEEARRMANEMIAAGALVPDTILEELLWEEQVRGVLLTKDMGRMLMAVSKTGSHNGGGYITEAVLWGLAVCDTKVIGRLPDLIVLRGNNTVKFKPWSKVVRIAAALQRSLDSNVPLVKRLDDLGAQLWTTPSVVNLETELLIWLAATKCLRRLKQRSLAAITQREYNALNLRLSEGQSEDVFGWLSENPPIPAEANEGESLADEDKGEISQRTGS